MSYGSLYNISYANYNYYQALYVTTIPPL